MWQSTLNRCTPDSSLDLSVFKFGHKTAFQVLNQCPLTLPGSVSPQDHLLWPLQFVKGSHHHRPDHKPQVFRLSPHLAPSPCSPSYPRQFRRLGQGVKSKR